MKRRSCVLLALFLWGMVLLPACGKQERSQDIRAEFASGEEAVQAAKQSLLGAAGFNENFGLPPGEDLTGLYLAPSYPAYEAADGEAAFLGALYPIENEAGRLLLHLDWTGDANSQLASSLEACYNLGISAWVYGRDEIYIIGRDGSVLLCLDAPVFYDSGRDALTEESPLFSSLPEWTPLFAERVPIPITPEETAEAESQAGA